MVPFNCSLRGEDSPGGDRTAPAAARRRPPALQGSPSSPRPLEEDDDFGAYGSDEILSPVATAAAPTPSSKQKSPLAGGARSGGSPFPNLTPPPLPLPSDLRRGQKAMIPGGARKTSAFAVIVPAVRVRATTEAIAVAAPP